MEKKQIHLIKKNHKKKIIVDNWHSHFTATITTSTTNQKAKLSLTLVWSEVTEDAGAVFISGLDLDTTW